MVGRKRYGFVTFPLDNRITIGMNTAFRLWLLNVVNRMTVGPSKKCYNL